VDYLLIAPELFTGDGGIARILRLYLKALCENAGANDTVRLVSLNDGAVNSSDIRRYSGPRLVEWEFCGRSKMKFARAAIRMGVRSNEIICGHVAQLPLAWAASKLRAGVSYSLVAHGIEVWRPFSFLEVRAIRGARRIFCVSDFTQRELLKHCPLPPGRTFVLPNALDPSLDPKSDLSSPASPPVVLTISRLSIADSYKGISHLVEAMTSIRETIPGTRLRIVGRGDALPSLQALAAKLGLAGSVEFAGFRSDAELRGEFERCRLFALPSQKEGFGLVYLEAMAHARPCLGARSGGVPEVITEETGVLVEYGDVPGIASAIAGVLRRDWPVGPLLRRAQEFSYARFKERLASMLNT
jgi:glycosyltransferase involved in cell wall biosynthesis